MKRSLLSLGAALATATVLLAGCGSDTDNGSAATTTAAGATTTAAGAASSAFPLTVTGANGKVTFDEAPTKIVSLAPSLTETLFAVDAGKQVVAVDALSNYPADAPKTDLSGYEPNIEAIGGYDPDLVIASDDQGGLVAGLEKIKVPVLILPAATDLDDVYQQIETVGDLTGHSDKADDVVDGMKTEIKQLAEQVPTGAKATYYYELDNTLYTVTSKTFIGSLFTMAGYENIADGADKTGNDYPQLSAEYLIEKNPQAIFLADTKCCGQNADTVAKRPGWSTLQAVTDKHVFELDDDIASRWGPRIVDLFKAIVEARTSIGG